MKYKTKKLLDEMEDSNSYVEIDNTNDINQAQIVENSSVTAEAQQDEADLTITSAMEKYFYPRFEKLTKFENRIKAVYDKVNSSIPNKPKRKYGALRVILQTLLSIGIGCASAFAFFAITNAADIGPVLILGGVMTIVTGVATGVVDRIIYKQKVKRKNKKAIELNNELVGIIVEDKKHIDSFVNCVNDYKKMVDLSKQVAIDDIAKIQTSVAKFNQEIYNAIERVYDVTQNTQLMELVAKYKKTDNCCKDINQILDDFNTLKKILPTLSIYAPQIIDKDNTNVIYSFRADEANLLIKTMIPFAQVLNVTYSKVYENYCEEQHRAEEKNTQQKLRQQEEEKLRKEIEKKEFEKENKKYKEFFDNYGIEAELDHYEKTK